MNTLSRFNWDIPLLFEGYLKAFLSPIHEVLSFLSFSKAAITFAVATACDSPVTCIRLSTNFSMSF